MKLLVDRTLGRLARLLRLLGYDTAWGRETSSAALLAQAESEDRLLLTRDTLLVERRAVHLGHVRALLVRGNTATASPGRPLTGTTWSAASPNLVLLNLLLMRALHRIR